VSDLDAILAIAVVLGVCIIWTAYAVRRVMDR
jgi:hypothetical protein